MLCDRVVRTDEYRENLFSVFLTKRINIYLMLQPFWSNVIPVSIGFYVECRSSYVDAPESGQISPPMCVIFVGKEG